MISYSVPASGFFRHTPVHFITSGGGFMTKKKYLALSFLVAGSVGGAFLSAIPQVGNALSIPVEHVLAYAFILTGLSVFYFGLLRPEWFTKQIIPMAQQPVKIKVDDKKKDQYKFSLKDDAYFWKVFPYGLFFTFGGFAYLMQPSPYSILVAAGCAAWVQVLYKYV